MTILQNMCKCAKSFSFWGRRPQAPTEALPLDPTAGPNLLIGQCLFYASLEEFVTSIQCGVNFINAFITLSHTLTVPGTAWLTSIKNLA